jgi:nucleoside 2-deoxyribosyltransferase
VKVYLAGTINTNDDYFQRWRKEASAFLSNHGIMPLSPLAQKEVALSTDGGITSNIPSEDILMRDYTMVRSAHLILANLKLVGDGGSAITKPLIGTFFEMAWAWEARKPILAVVEPDNYLFMKHPFLYGTITHRFDTLEEALHNIVSYWNWHWSDPHRD